MITNSPTVRIAPLHSLEVWKNFHLAATSPFEMDGIETTNVQESPLPGAIDQVEASVNPAHAELCPLASGASSDKFLTRPLDVSQLENGETLAAS